MHDLMSKINLNYSCTEEVQVNSFKNSLHARKFFMFLRGFFLSSYEFFKLNISFRKIFLEFHQSVK